MRTQSNSEYGNKKQIQTSYLLIRVKDKYKNLATDRLAMYPINTLRTAYIIISSCFSKRQKPVPYYFRKQAGVCWIN